MTYLVQKTNMFKQKMKIDDNIICNKMLTVQLWCICTWIWLRSIVLTKAVMYYPRLPGGNFRRRALCLSPGTVCYFIPLHISGLHCKHRLVDKDTFISRNAKMDSVEVLQIDMYCNNIGGTQCWHRTDILIPPPKSVAEQKTSCCAKPVGSFLL